MTRRNRLVATTFVLSACCQLALSTVAARGEANNPPAAPAKAPAAPGLGDPGQLLEVGIDSGRNTDGGFVLDGQDARQQLVVTGKYSTGQLRDLTTKTTYEVAPEGIVSVEKSGLVIPKADGHATITAKTADGVAGAIKAT